MRKATQLLYLINIIFLVSISACNFQNMRKTENLNDYLETKKEFDFWLVKHFPNLLNSEISTHINSKIESKNNIGLYLYEYDVELSKLKKIQSISEKSAVAHYKMEDTLIFIINRFETLQTDYNGKFPKIDDSLYVDSTLYAGLYPVPNFIGYEKPVKTKNGIWLPKEFDLYVLEAKSGDYCTEFELKENFQMPKGWKNGFSRGVAIDEKERTIIYWGVLW